MNVRSPRSKLLTSNFGVMKTESMTATSHTSMAWHMILKCSFKVKLDIILSLACYDQFSNHILFAFNVPSSPLWIDSVPSNAPSLAHQNSVPYLSVSSHSPLQLHKTHNPRAMARLTDLSLEVFGEILGYLDETDLIASVTASTAFRDAYFAFPSRFRIRRFWLLPTPRSIGYRGHHAIQIGGLGYQFY